MVVFPSNRFSCGTPMHEYHDKPFLDLHKLLDFNQIAVQCPDSPDADALSAGYALYRFFSDHGKNVKLFYSGPSEIERANLLEMLKTLDSPLVYEPNQQAWDGLLITVGCQYGAANLSAFPAKAVAVIDHHLPEGSLPELSDIRPYLSSCSTLVWQLLQRTGYSIDSNLASVLLYGLYDQSNGFSEIRFPLDRDMIDLLDNGRFLFERLKHSSLRLEDLTLTGQALSGLKYHAEGRFLLITVPFYETNILRFITDLALMVQGVDLVVAFSQSAQGVRFSVRTESREAKAFEVAEWIVRGEIGTGGGTKDKGGGFITAGSYEKYCPDMDPLQFFLKTVRTYFEAYDIIDCGDSDSAPQAAMEVYQKLPITLGFVRCSQLFPQKSTLHVRMLEGDISLTINARTYLMIGLSGEVYPISKEKFFQSYIPKWDPFVLKMPYAPTVLDDNTATRVSLLEHAEECSSREGRVFARQLERGVKLFTQWDSENYIRGETGDWLMQRGEDDQDLYIITKELFPRLYKKIGDSA